jgi:CRISPR-associated protein (TIGR03984 family)
MAQQSINLYISRTKNEEQISLTAAVKRFITGFGKDLSKQTFAVLYAPSKCHLAILQGQEFHDANGKIDTASVFEARVFNEKAEMRWLNIASGIGKAVVLSTDDNQFFDSKKDENYVDIINQDYLLWGRSTGKPVGDWTQFAEARIGPFLVPLKSVGKDAYAKLTAIEYLGEYEDGNMAVAEERLTGIEIV